MSAIFLRKLTVFHFELAKILSAGVVIAGAMQTTAPTWKILVGGALAFMIFIIGVGFDSAATNKSPP